MEEVKRGSVSDNTIVNASCQDVASLIKDVDVVLTSPFYNTSVKSLVKSREELGNANQRGRYDTLVDVLTNEQYCQFMVDLFNKMHDGLKDTGTVLFNISYSADNPDGYILAVADILRKTEFRLVDKISWIKSTCIPNISSINRLTRKCEDVFVFCKRGFEKTFYCNKKEISSGTATHKCYENIYNVVEARTGGEDKCPFNKATYSVDLCRKLLSIYAPPNALVFDPFMGSGTTAVACVEMGMRYIGSEISRNQVEWAKTRIANRIVDLWDGQNKNV